MKPIDRQIEEAVEVITRDPFLVASWQSLLVLVTRRSDFLSKKTVEVIIGGLSVVADTEYSEKKFHALTQVLERVARSYNNANLLKQLGLVYKNDFKWPAVARSHFELARSLGCQDADLLALLQAPDVPLPEPKGPLGVKQARSSASVKAVKRTFRKTGRLSLLGASALANPGTTQPSVQIAMPEEPSARLDAAEMATSQGKVDSAYRLLESIDPATVDNDLLWDAWSNLGEAFYKLEQFMKSEESYRCACTLKPDIMVSHFNLGTALLVVNRYEQALKCFFQADALDPEHPKVWCNIGSATFLQGDYASSEAAMRKCLALKPDYARAWDNLGSALGAQGKMDEAFVACTKALALRPGYPEATFKLGLLHFTRNRFSEALPMFMETITCDTLSGYAYAYLSMTFSILGNVSAAKKALANANIKDPELLGAAWSALGWAFIEGKDLVEGRNALGEAAKQCPENAEYWTHLAETHQALGEQQEAAACFQKSASLGSVANVA
jgi:tetratricopeptide (TPR) repeat protein